MTSCLQSWPEPIVRVQSLSESGVRTIPERYIKNPTERPAPPPPASMSETTFSSDIQIPVIDLQNLYSPNDVVRELTFDQLKIACCDWGFFQVVNHGVSHQLMSGIREIWREFFHLPLEMKQKYANSPTTYEGYGSRLGVEKGAKLDWSDYFFLNFLPTPLRDQTKWPSLPLSCRKMVTEYGEELVKLSEKLLKVLSVNIGLKHNYLEQAFGGKEAAGVSLRINFYPKCPQPDLTLGLSSHSDPGGITVLLPDHEVSGLQVSHGNSWMTVKPIPNAFIVNIGDQLQIMSNAIYKSVEHRVVVNSEEERVSLAFFYNPSGEIVVKPAEQLVTEEKPALYPPMTFNEYRTFIRRSGLSGKTQVESLKSPTHNIICLEMENSH